GAGAVLAHVLTQLRSAKPAALAVAAITLAVALLVRRYRRHWPHMLIGLVVATSLAWVWSLFLGGGATPSSSLRVIGQIATPWPRFELPRISWAQASDLVGLAFALTIVALGQAISIAKTVALRSGQRIDANREFRGQGLSNIIGGFFSSYVSCGSMNRSMPNLEAGARTPLASVFSALLLLGLVALSSQLLAQIPMAALSALLLLVALTLLDFARWRQLFSLSRTDFGVALATMVATVTIRLEMAILLGMLLSLMSFLYRTSRPAMRSMGFDSRGLDRQLVVIDDAPQASEEASAAPFQSGPQNRLCRAAGAAAPSGGSAVREATSVGVYLPECPQLKLLRMEGEVYFGATQHVADILHALRSQPNPQKHLLVMAKSMNFIDLAGAELWEAELAARRAMGGNLYFHRPRPEVIRMWHKTGFTDVLGPAHQFPDKFTAISTIFSKLDPDICRHCSARIFEECKTAAGADDPANQPAS
ncbi:MAG: solute carrier family 23 protein, partial [Polaromonas sp.]